MTEPFEVPATCAIRVEAESGRALVMVEGRAGGWIPLFAEEVYPGVRGHAAQPAPEAPRS